MKKLNKKLLYSITALATTAAPVAAVVACGKKTIASKDNAADANTIAAQKAASEKLAADLAAAQKAIDTVAALKAAPTIAGHANLGDIAVSQVTGEMIHNPTTTEAVDITLKTSAKSSTSIDFTYVVSSHFEGTTPKEYTVTLNGFAVAAVNGAEQKALDQASLDKAAAEAKMNALVSSKHPLTFVSTFDASKTTAAFVTIADINSYTEGNVTLKPMVVVKGKEDGTSVLVTVKATSNIAGVVEQTYSFELGGLESQVSYSSRTSQDVSAMINNPVEFADIKLDPAVPQWNGFVQGPAYAIGSHGLSYLINFAKKLGWTPEAVKPIVVPSATSSGPISVDGYTAGKTTPTAHERTLADSFNSKISGTISGGIGQTYPSTGSIFQNAKTFEPATDSNMLGAGNHTTINLKTATYANGDFLGKQVEGSHGQLYILAKAFQTLHLGSSQLDAYKNTDKLLFSIDDSTQTLHLWTASSAQVQHDLMQKRLDAQKALEAQIAAATTTLDVATTKLNPAGSDRSTWDPFNVMGINVWDGANKHADQHMIDFTGNPGGNDLGQSDHGHTCYIDGDHPGQLISKVWTTYGTSAEWHSAPNRYATFPIISGAEKERTFALVKAMIENVQKFAKGKVSQLGSNVNSDFKSALNFVSEGTFSDTQLKTAFDALNNGSHYLKIVEYFARGVKDVAHEWRPTGALIGNSLTNLQGFASITDVMKIAWAFYTDDQDDKNGVSHWVPATSTSPATPVDSLYSN